MAEATKDCPKCSGKMSIGYLVEGIGMGIATLYNPDRWVEGERKTEKLRIGYRKEFSVDSFRCSACGYLEFYASREIS